mmetsp:Transcript_39323/g.86313  ORF Transcript_39323/g.86313 Transcript_39323/m.86313 type:complete len:447 (+) Transcript_39323:89-1429(+)
MSLLSSIFGGGATATTTTSASRHDAVKNESHSGGSLSSLFDGSTKLPEAKRTNVAAAKIAASSSASGISPSKEERRNEKEASSDDDDGDSSSDESGAASEKKSEAGQDTVAVDDEVGSSKDNSNNNDVDDNSEERTIFVGNLPPSTTRKSLASLFKSCGKISSTRLRSVAVEGVKLPPDQAGNQKLVKKVCANTNKISHETPKKTAQGYVVFESADSVPEALKMNNKPIKADGLTLHLRVDRSKQAIDSTRSVFVGNLPYAADEASLRRHFVTGCEMDEDDDIENVRIIRDPDTQQCKGFGYVLLRDRSHVAAALRMHESVYMKRQLRVMVCGKRFKGKRGRQNDASRSFEGSRATDAAGGARRVSGKKRKQSSATPSGAIAASVLKAGNVGKKKRVRGLPSSEKHRTGGRNRKAGVSKRAAVEAKANKRVKQIKKRISKGMGKAK